MSLIRRAESERLYASLPTPRAPVLAVHDALATGHSLDHAADAAGISRPAFGTLREQNPDFADAVERGLVSGKRQCSRWLRQMVPGTPTDAPDWFQGDAAVRHMAENYQWDTSDLPSLEVP